MLRICIQGVEFLLNFMKSSNSSSSSRNRVSALNAQIREAVSRLENVLEPYASNQIVSQSESRGDETNPFSVSTDLQHLEQDIYSFSETVMKLKEKRSSLFEEDDDDDASHKEDDDDDASHKEDDDDASHEELPSRIFKGEMVGLSHEFRQMKNRLTRFCPFPFQVFSLVGMAGIGKTSFASRVFKDPDILEYFDCRVWVTVGKKCQLKEITRAILAQVNPDNEMHTEGDEEIALHLKEVMTGKRCLIVLDDVWETQVWHDLKGLFPLDENGSRVLLTTRLQEVARDASKSMYGVQEMRLLSKEESWNLLHEMVFAGESCPPPLEKAGKKIAKNCEGLPLTIVTIAKLLSKATKSPDPEYWNRVAENQKSLFMNAYSKISKVLYSSYEYLTPHLKVCFLYMGFFPQNYAIPKSKLINMWTAEGFFESQTSKYSSVQYLEELISNNLVVVCQKSTTAKGIKTCRLHSSLWYLCKREAAENKIFHVLHSLEDGTEEGEKSQRRLCIHSNILSGSKGAYKSLEDNCASTARFLLYYGPSHQYPVPICSGLKWLKVLDALTIRFYKFPIEVLDLVLLKYLALTYDGSLPTSISKLSNLQFLIVCQHLSIIYHRALSFLPMEIWALKELKHLQVVGSSLPDCCDALLLNLQTLLDVSAHNCTKGVFTRIPNLKKLGIRIELVPDEPLCCFDDISNLYRLESLKCVVVNVELRSMVVAPPLVLSKFPLGLTKLTLSGLGYPWEYMKVIASLPNLEVLKLRYYAFRGPKWETEENGFSELRFLLIEDTDLVQLKVGHRGFPKLIRLSIRRCYKLEELHWVTFDGLVPDIDIVDCNSVDVRIITED